MSSSRFHWLLPNNPSLYETRGGSVHALLNELGLAGRPDIIMIDGRADNKPSGSKA